MVHDAGMFVHFPIAGAIVGTGHRADSSVASFVLTPVAGDATFADGLNKTPKERLRPQNDVLVGIRMRYT